MEMMMMLMMIMRRMSFRFYSCSMHNIRKLNGTSMSQQKEKASIHVLHHKICFMFSFRFKISYLDEGLGGRGGRPRIVQNKLPLRVDATCKVSTS